MVETLSVFDDVFSDSGLLAQNIRGYEFRSGQKEIAESIWEAFSEEKNALFEAGTGIGKSLAYLAPALLWSYKTGEKIVISTYTIALQEQLIEKDLPVLLNALGIDLHIVLAKGMNNYLCMKKLEDPSNQGRFFDQDMDELIRWSQKSADGTKSAIPFAIAPETWSKVYAESDACFYAKCPHYHRCFFFKARSKVQTADVVIVNHHLLMSHLLAEGERAILPPFSRLIIDEAHHLENVARTTLSRTLNRIELYKQLGKAHSDIHPEVSRFFYIRDQVRDKKLKVRLDIDLPGEKRNLVKQIDKAFDLLDQYFTSNSSSLKLRITPQIVSNRTWQSEIIPAFTELVESLKCYSSSLKSIEDEIDDETKAKVENALLEISGSIQYLNEAIDTIELFLKEEDVRWVEKQAAGITLTLAKLDVAPFLKEKLFSSIKSAILCSATLSVGGKFAHIKEGLGMSGDTIEGIYPSPFDFHNRTRLLGIKDIPPPNHYNFVKEACDVIRNAIEISGGGAFVLFTSYDMLEKCADKLSDLPILKQGDLPRNRLLEEFKEREDGILFGTDSFWEGVDVSGRALRLVIIVKLPFPVPTEPLLEARFEQLKAEGKDPFNEVSIPSAVMKFKQGFGRLMRHKSDFGSVLCLDERLFSRSYGKAFLRSLPECVISYNERKEIFREMRNFYGDWSVAVSNR